MTYKVEYSSNNSGGSWWLEDRHWKALEKAGWIVEYGDYFTFRDRPNDRPKTYAEAIRADQRFLGALATRAYKECDDPVAAIREFEKLTGEDVTAEGCNCCGAPHHFSWRDEDNQYQGGSGENLLPILFPHGGPRTLREAYEGDA